MAPLHAFELLPDALVGIELWGLGWQVLQMQALCRASREELLDDMLRWIGAPSQMSTIRPGTSRRRCSQKAITSSEFMASCWQSCWQWKYSLPSGDIALLAER
jgi:hypothetical protein